MSERKFEFRAVPGGRERVFETDVRVQAARADAEADLRAVENLQFSRGYN